MAETAPTLTPTLLRPPSHAIEDVSESASPAFINNAPQFFRESLRVAEDLGHRSMELVRPKQLLAILGVTALASFNSSPVLSSTRGGMKELAQTGYAHHPTVLERINIMLKKCPDELAVSSEIRHARNRSLGSLTAYVGNPKYNVYVLKRRSNVRECGAYTGTGAYVTSDGVVHPGKLKIVMPNRKDRYKLPKKYEGFTVLLSSHVKK